MGSSFYHKELTRGNDHVRRRGKGVWVIPEYSCTLLHFGSGGAEAEATHFWSKSLETYPSDMGSPQASTSHEFETG